MTAYNGIYAVANLRCVSLCRYSLLEPGLNVEQANHRGGGEFGIKWREAGSVHNKQNVFDDFQAAVHLIYVMLSNKE